MAWIARARAAAAAEKAAAERPDVNDPASRLRIGSAMPLRPRRGKPREVRVPAGARCSTPPAGTASPSTPPAAGTAPAASARCRWSRARSRCRGWTRARSPPTSSARGGGWRARPGHPGPAREGAAVGHPAQGGHRRRRPAGDPAARAAEALRGAVRAELVGSAHRRRTAARRPGRPGPAGGPGGACAACRGRCAPGPQVTAVVVDDVLIDVEPGDTTGRRFGVAFDLGTTTVVATLLDLATGTPVAVASMLNPQQPFGADVITRISATMMDPHALDRLSALAHEVFDQLTGEVCDEGGVERGEVYEIALAGNATMTHLALGIDPEPLGRRAVHHGVAIVRGAAGHRPRRPGAPAGPRLRVPGPGRLRRRRHRRGRVGVGDGPRPADPAVHRHRHQLRDPARRRRPAAGHRGPGGAGVRGRGDPLRHARRARRRRGREDQRRRRAAAGHRRRRTPRPRGFGAGRRRRGAGRRRPRGRLRAVDPAGRAGRAAGPGRPPAAGRQGAGVRAALPRRRSRGVVVPVPARHP